MTSVERELGADAPPFASVADTVARSFGTIFALDTELLQPEVFSATLAQL
jgi:hypothetical protein